ncbi:Autoinducer 2 sensor kinase/phosphatase LuxQ [Salinivirga cyanobacteriivorans]|uniref:histidine kinase n=1 Tax=Salinivirga cyanobacteriivorans TaxID=1307839 RepID=A0A0S2HWK4_9BACT|nr:PAS domain S-box protein [Salinivirga cyanobacteriivorans]ALO14324.1 Autoinducer 2 sensor kinase/phosphatase LuxQ [Salinivirga cyanobacteriivorans]
MSLSNKYRKDLRKKAEAILKKQGGKNKEELGKDLESLVEELNIYHIELEEQNRELQLLQQASEEQKNKYVDLFENAPNAYLIIDTYQHIISANKKASEMLNIAQPRLKQQKLSLFLDPEYQDEFYFMLKNTLKQTKSISRQLAIINANEERKTVYCTAEAFGDHRQLLRIAMVDITTQKQLEEENTFKANILENVTDCIFTINNRGNITYWSKGAKALLGFTPEKMLNTNPAKIFPNIPPSYFSALREKSEIQLEQGFQWKAIAANKKTIWLQVKITKLNNENNTEKDTYIIVAKDITLQKNAEDALRSSKQQIEKILNSIDDRIYISDPATFEILFTNIQNEQEAEHILSQKCYKTIYEKDQQCSYCKFNNLKKISKADQIKKEIFVEQTGKYYQVVEKPITWTNNKSAIMHTLTDITDVKMSKKELLENEEMLSNLTNAANDGIIMVDKKGTIKFWNPEASNIFGFSHDEAIGKEVHQLITDSKKSSSAKEALKNLAKSGNSKKFNQTFELEARKKDGSIFTAELSLASVKLKDDLNAIGIVRDITKRKQEEMRLQESENRYRTIVDNVKEALYIHTTDGEFLDCNTALLQLTQYSYNDLQNIHPKEVIDEETGKKYFARLQKLVEKKHLTFNTTIIKKNGEKLPVEINANLIHYKGREAVLISARDITDRIIERQKLEESEKRFRTMADNIPDAIYIHNLEGQILDTNEKATEMLGYKREELLKMTPLDISAIYFNFDEYEDIVKKIEEEGLVIFEDKHLTKTNKKIPVQITSTVISYKNKPAVFSVAHDITNRKKADKSQNKLINQLNYLSKSATKFISFNDYEDIYRFLGKSLHLAIENSIIVVKKYENERFQIIDFYGENIDINIQQLKAYEKGLKTFKPDPERLKKYKSGKLEKSVDLKTLLNKKYPREFIEKINKTYQISETRVIGVTRDDVLYAGINILTEQPMDITDQEFTQALVYQASIALQRKNHENELIKAKVNAEVANNAKSAFLTNMSHEIRTPINTILGFTEILSNDITDEQQINYLKSINSSGKSLLTIINDILDLSKIESGNMPIKHDPMSIKTLINDMEFIFRAQAREKGLNFKISIDKSVPRLVKLDQPRLRQILQNLISNAIKFTYQGKVELQANTANSENDKTDLIFKVIDTGKGISRNKLNAILEPFQQEDSSDARKFEGTGMGLSIARKLTSLLNGELKIESEIDKGSVFTIHLPSIPVLETESYNVQSINTNKLKFDRERILLVEEDTNQGEIIQSMLEKHNLTVLTAETGDQAFAFANEFNPQLAIIDLSTQTHKSIGTAKDIRSLDQFSNLPIIGITRHSKQEFDGMEISKYFSDIIKPPLTKSAIFKQIMKYIECKKTLSKDDNTNTETFDFSSYETTSLENALNSLKENASPIWDLLEKRQPLNKVKSFNHVIYKTGEQEHILILKQYSKQLTESLKAFDIIQMRKLLKEYPGIIKAIEKQIDKNKK